VSRGRGPRVRDSGTATVEFALVVPLLLLLVLGIIDFGRMASFHVRLSAAARAAAQAAALGEDASSIAAAADAVFLGGSGAVTIDKFQACPANPLPGATGTATITIDFKFITPLGAMIGKDGNETMTAEGAVPCRA
jgi:hypothetical protein